MTFVPRPLRFVAVPFAVAALLGAAACSEPIPTDPGPGGAEAWTPSGVIQGQDSADFVYTGPDEAGPLATTVGTSGPAAATTLFKVGPFHQTCGAATYEVCDPKPSWAAMIYVAAYDVWPSELPLSDPSVEAHFRTFTAKPGVSDCLTSGRITQGTVKFTPMEGGMMLTLSGTAELEPGLSMDGDYPSTRCVAEAL